MWLCYTVSFSSFGPYSTKEIMYSMCQRPFNSIVLLSPTHVYFLSFYLWNNGFFAQTSEVESSKSHIDVKKTFSKEILCAQVKCHCNRSHSLVLDFHFHLRLSFIFIITIMKLLPVIATLIFFLYFTDFVIAKRVR